MLYRDWSKLPVAKLGRISSEPTSCSNKQLDDRDYWDSMAPVYAGLYDNDWSHLEDRFISNIVGDILWREDPPIILDVGCASRSIYSKLPNNRATTYIGLDYSLAMLENNPLNRIKNTMLINGQMEKIPLGDRSADLTMALFGTCSYSNDIESFLRELRRVAKQDGLVLLSFLSRFSLLRLLKFQLVKNGRLETRVDNLSDNGPRVHFYTPDAARALVELAGFKSTFITGEGVLAGLFERPALWSINHLLSQSVPGLSHSFAIVVSKGGNNAHCK